VVSDHWASPPRVFTYDANVDTNGDTVSISDMDIVSDHWGEV